jgi:hypothetical protein
MNVDLATAFIAEYKVAVSRIIPRHIAKASLVQQRADLIHIFVLNSNIQICMRPSLCAKQRIDGPPAIDVKRDVIPIEEFQDLDHIFHCHFGNVVWHVRSY